MDHSNVERRGFLALLIVLTFAGLYVIWPFFGTIVLGVALTILFKPLHLKYIHLTKGYRNVAATLSVSSVYILILIPVTTILTLLASQVSAMVNFMTRRFSRPTVTNMIDQLGQKLEIQPMKFELLGINFNLGPLITKGLEKMTAAAAAYSPQLIEDILNFSMHLFIMTVVLFYFFREGENFFKWLLRFIPIKNKYKMRLSNEIEVTVRGVFYGNFLTAFIQAVLAIVGFYFIGIEGFLVWGALTFCMAFLPMIGTAAALIPLIILLFLQGDSGKAWTLVVYGVFVIGLVDNIFKPFLMRSKIHPLVLFLSIFGGLIVFGPVGLLFGPMILALLTSALSIYDSDFPESHSNESSPL